MELGISVILTVGPDEAYKRYLNECIESILTQETFGEDIETVLVDDAAHLGSHLPVSHSIKYIKNVWNLGQAASINIAVASAKYDLVFIMGGCDDKLLPNCLKKMLFEWQGKQNKTACYTPTIITSEGEISNLPQGVWMMHRQLWAKLGGYPKEAAVGEVDSIFCSLMLKQNVVMHYVDDNQPLYWHREHPASLTANKSFMRNHIAMQIREMCTLEWADPVWRKGYGYEK